MTGNGNHPEIRVSEPRRRVPGSGPILILAIVIVPLIIVTFYRALRNDFARHRRIARITLPLWLYVSITGVIVYLMLYQIYPS